MVSTLFHMLKVMPCDIITQNVFYRLSMEKRLGFVHQDLERYRGFVSKRHYAHMNEGDWCVKTSATSDVGRLTKSLNPLTAESI